MNYLVFLDAQAGELEKILSGVKTMLIRENEPGKSCPCRIDPGDRLYFLRGREDRVVRVMATVVRVLGISRHGEQDLAHALKEMQPRLYLTEGQYNDWSARLQAELVEFASAQKIDPFRVDSNKMQDQRDWISFEEFGSVVQGNSVPLLDAGREQTQVENL